MRSFKSIHPGVNLKPFNAFIFRLNFFVNEAQMLTEGKDRRLFITLRVLDGQLLLRYLEAIDNHSLFYKGVPVPRIYETALLQLFQWCSNVGPILVY